MQIRLAKKTEINLIQEFIKLNWNANHIFVRNRKFLKYEMSYKENFNFAISLHNNKITGCLGFIQNKDKLAESDLYLVIFKVINEFNQNTNIGVRLLKFVQSLTIENIHTIGANDKVLNYYKFLGFNVGYMEHLFWLNEKKSESDFYKNNNNKISLMNNKINYDYSNHFTIFPKKKLSHKYLKKIYIKNKKLKSINIFLKRYKYHPIYKYTFFNDIKKEYIGVIRKVKINNHKAIRIVDWYGDHKDLPKFTIDLINFAKRNNYIFIDLYISGFSIKNFKKTGLIPINDNVIIPNYLEPIVYKNIKISYATTSKIVPIMMRGDCDQDRPS